MQAEILRENYILLIVVMQLSNAIAIMATSKIVLPAPC